jgi:hypothetical protein
MIPLFGFRQKTLPPDRHSVNWLDAERPVLGHGWQPTYYQKERNKPMTNGQVKTAGIAITSLVLGILSYILCLGPLTAIPAIICGHVAKSKIKAAAGALGGDGLARAGLILGYANIGLMIVIILSFKWARITSQAKACIGNQYQLEAAKDQYAIEYGLTKGARITFADIGPTNTALGGFMKNWPNCPASSNYANTNKSAQLSELDYDINVIGRNAVCKHCHDATPGHKLP